ncbi:GNAT family N-acetyltransferase [Lacticaseibacillus absianus]|uniref:GNAT family N-acetyltransferase n=1 Tax=Lacticaseibacillus absianus TaxID=2729623 RepID=UPI0015CB8568|nr:GNAT family N-acetyltransferase [Lacticaseibacillus absianus]
MIQIAPATPDQLDALMRIERAGFTPAEAATVPSMTTRIATIPDTFLVATDAQAVVGFIVGPAYTKRYLDDALYARTHPNQPDAPYQTVLSLAVAPTRRGQGLGSQLLTALADVARAQGRRAMTLTCLAALVPFYTRNGFVNEGRSASTHAGEVWYNLVQTLHA